MKPPARSSRSQPQPNRSREDRPNKSEGKLEHRMRVLMFGCSADDAQHALKYGDRMEVAYLPSYDMKEIWEEIERFNPQLVTCSTDLFLSGAHLTSSDVTNRDSRQGTKASESDATPRVAPREMKVLTMLANGRTNSEIATALRISSRTVKRILSHLFELLKASNRTQLASRAARFHLIENDD